MAIVPAELPLENNYKVHVWSDWFLKGAFETLRVSRAKESRKKTVMMRMTLNKILKNHIIQDSTSFTLASWQCLKQASVNKNAYSISNALRTRQRIPLIYSTCAFNLLASQMGHTSIYVRANAPESFCFRENLYNKSLQRLMLLVKNSSQHFLPYKLRKIPMKLGQHYKRYNC